MNPVPNRPSSPPASPATRNAGPRRWLRGVAVTLALVAGVGVVAGRQVLVHDAPCATTTPIPPGDSTMRALVHRCYGSPDVLTIDTVEAPRPAANELLVRVQAAALNPLDWHFLRGTPYVMRLDSGIGRPNDPRVGVDFAGVVEAVGADVTTFKVGDEILGGKSGAVADYVVVRASGPVVRRPAGLSAEDAAAIPIAGVTALQAVRDHGQVRAGQRVLVNGASGGVGTFAVQIAKSLGAEVTGVSSTRNLDLVRSLGADHVVDYTHDDFTLGDVRYDVIIDAVGNRSLGDLRRALTPTGTAVVVGGGGPDDSLLGPLTLFARTAIYNRLIPQRFAMFIADLNVADLQTLTDLAARQTVRPVIDRRYPLPQAADAMRYLETGRARGKVIIEMGAPAPPAAPASAREPRG